MGVALHGRGEFRSQGSLQVEVAISCVLFLSDLKFDLMIKFQAFHHSQL